MKLPKKISIKYQELSIKNRKNVGLVLCIAILATSYLILNTAPALAQELSRTVTLVYPALEHKIDPGGRAEGITKIINDSSVPLTFNLNVQDFVVTDTIGTPNILPPNTLSRKYSAAAWIGVTPNVFTLQPGQKQNLNYFIQVPKDARPGGHYAAIVYAPETKTGATGTGSTVNSQLGSIFYITINGPVKEQALITKFFANPFQEYGPVKILTQLKNLGDLHVAPKGTVTVTGLLFNSTQDLAGHNIFPEAARDFQNTFGQTLMVGRYKAVLLASYGVNNNLPLTATVYFWVFPWRIAVVITLAIIALILAALYLRKRRKDGPSKPTKPQEEAVVSPTTPTVE
jgi:hypothetical protein